VDYGRNPAWLYAHPATTLAFSAMTFALLIVAWRTRRRAPLLAAGIFVFMAALLPNAGLVPSDIQQWSTVADRYAYAAMLGPALLLAWALSQPIVRRHALPAIVLTGLALSALTAKAVAQASYWHDDARLFTHVVRLNPDSWIGHDHLSFGLLRIDPARAVAEAKIALRLRPNAADPHRTLASAYIANGNRAAAIDELREALRMGGGTELDTRQLLASLLGDAGDHAGAMEQYRASLRLEPDNAIVMTNLAAELAEAGRPGEAIPLYQSALRLSPNLEAARRGLVLAQSARDHAPPVTQP
jgi:tetratricopeptide (TPR) repeat protein